MYFFSSSLGPFHTFCILVAPLSSVNLPSLRFGLLSPIHNKRPRWEPLCFCLWAGYTAGIFLLIFLLRAEAGYTVICRTRKQIQFAQGKGEGELTSPFGFPETLSVPKGWSIAKVSSRWKCWEFSTIGYGAAGEGSDFCKQESIYKFPSPPALMPKQNKQMLCNNTEKTPRIG